MEHEESTQGKRSRRRLIWIAGLTVFDIVAYNLFVRNGGYDASGAYVPYSPSTALMASLSSFLFAFPVICLVIGAIIAIIPYKGRAYKDKLWRVSSLAMFIIYGIVAIVLVLFALMTLVGWYPPKETRLVETITDKGHETELFVSEMRALCDTGNIYFDKAIAEANRSGGMPRISEGVKSRLLDFQDQMNQRSESFSKQAGQLGLTRSEMEKIFNDLNTYVKPVRVKLDSLKRLGVSLE